MALAKAFGHILDLRPISVSSPSMVLLIVTKQLQAIRLAVSRAIGPAARRVGFLLGIMPGVSRALRPGS